jgi:hypothetical protein
MRPVYSTVKSTHLYSLAGNFLIWQMSTPCQPLGCTGHLVRLIPPSVPLPPPSLLKSPAHTADALITSSTAATPGGKKVLRSMSLSDHYTPKVKGIPTSLLIGGVGPNGRWQRGDPESIRQKGKIDSIFTSKTPSSIA